MTVSILAISEEKSKEMQYDSIAMPNSDATSSGADGGNAKEKGGYAGTNQILSAAEFSSINVVS